MQAEGRQSARGTRVLNNTGLGNALYNPGILQIIYLSANNFIVQQLTHKSRWASNIISGTRVGDRADISEKKWLMFAKVDDDEG